MTPERYQAVPAAAPTDILCAALPMGAVEAELRWILPNVTAVSVSTIANEVSDPAARKALAELFDPAEPTDAPPAHTLRAISQALRWPRPLASRMLGPVAWLAVVRWPGAEDAWPAKPSAPKEGRRYRAEHVRHLRLAAACIEAVNAMGRYDELLVAIDFPTARTDFYADEDAAR